jgi:serine/threonine protein kinase
MAKIALQGLTILKAIHSRGFIHGAVSDHSVRINQITGTVFFIDFSSATPWTDSSLRSPPREELLSDKSVFQLEGHPPSRRDDLIRFAELVLRLAGEPSFAQSREENLSLSPTETAQLKRKRKLTSTHQTPFVFVLFYLTAMDLAHDADPPYDQWISGFTKIRE